MSLNLTATNEIIEVVTTQALAVDVVVSYLDRTTTAVDAGGQQTAITTATTTTVVTAPAASTQRQILDITIVNKGAGTQSVTVQKDVAGTNFVLLGPIPLSQNARMEFTPSMGWRVFSAGGVERGFPGDDFGVTSGFLRQVSSGVWQVVAPATQADQETGTSTTALVAPAVQQFHPSACKGWCRATGNSTTITGQYNVSSVVNVSTGRMDCNWNTDFSGSADYAGFICVHSNSTSNGLVAREHSRASDLLQGTCLESTTAVRAHPTSWSFAGFGDQ